MTAPRRRDDLLTVALDDGLFVFDPVRVRAHALNPSAAMVWAHCDGSSDAEAIATQITAEIADQIGAEPGHPTSDARDKDLLGDVHTVIEHLGREGLLVHRGPNLDATITDDATPSTFPNVPHLDQPAPPGHDRHVWPETTPTYRGLEFRFRVATDQPELAAYLRLVLAPLEELTATAGAPPPATYTVETRPGGTDIDTEIDHGSAPRAGSIALDGHLVADRLADTGLAATVLWHVNQMVSTTSTHHLLLHASAVRIGDAAVVFPASMNSGKSTLVAALVQAGWPYLTDETAAVVPGTFDVLPYPKAIGLDPGSWPLLATLEPALPGELTRFGQAKWYVDARLLGPPGRPAPLGAVVFPRHTPGAATPAERLGPAAAAVELAQNSFNLPRLGADGIALVTEIARTVPCYRLAVDDLDTAIAAILDLVT